MTIAVIPHQLGFRFSRPLRDEEPAARSGEGRLGNARRESNVGEERNRFASQLEVFEVKPLSKERPIPVEKKISEVDVSGIASCPDDEPFLVRIERTHVDRLQLLLSGKIDRGIKIVDTVGKKKRPAV